MTIWRWFARKCCCYCFTTISKLFVNILYIGLSKASRLTTLRLFHDYFIGETATIGYDYSRSCYDYSSRNAATITCPYWLSGESPKRDTAVAVNGSAPPAAPLLLGCISGWSVSDRPAALWPLTRCKIASRRADSVQVETLTPQQVRRVQHLPAIYTR